MSTANTTPDAAMATVRLRLDPKVRKAALLKCALDLAAKHGLHHITRDMIAAAGDVSPGLVSQYLGTMPKLRDLVMREAVKQRVLPVVALGLAEGNRYANKAPQDLKDAALASLRR